MIRFEKETKKNMTIKLLCDSVLIMLTFTAILYVITWA
jgi:hypothetical protein